MISRTAEYALRAVVYLGNYGGSSRTTAEISEAIDAPCGYLAKVMQGLSRANIVRSQRGLRGGFTLAIDPNDLTTLHVVQAVDAWQRHPMCPLSRAARASELCPLHQPLERLMAAAEREFYATTISELLDGPATNNPCQYPCIFEPEKKEMK